MTQAGAAEAGPLPERPHRPLRTLSCRRTVVSHRGATCCISGLQCGVDTITASAQAAPSGCDAGRREQQLDGEAPYD